MPCESVQFHRHFNAISTQDSASRFRCYLCLAILCSSIAGQCEAEQVLCFPSLTPTSPLRFCARLHASPSRFDSSQCHCQTMLRLSFLRPCVSVRGDSLLCHSFAILCQTVLCLASATHCSTQPCRCFSGRIEATHFDAQPSRVTASQYFAFTEQNMSKPLHFSATPISAFPLRC